MIEIETSCNNATVVLKTASVVYLIQASLTLCVMKVHLHTQNLLTTIVIVALMP